MMAVHAGLGEAISYMVKHWEKLTLFLRKPGRRWVESRCGAVA